MWWFKKQTNKKTHQDNKAKLCWSHTFKFCHLRNSDASEPKASTLSEVHCMSAFIPPHTLRCFSLLTVPALVQATINHLFWELIRQPLPSLSSSLLALYNLFFHTVIKKNPSDDASFLSFKIIILAHRLKSKLFPDLQSPVPPDLHRSPCSLS